MKLSQKKTCEGCRAYLDGQGFRVTNCELGFRNKGAEMKIAGAVINRISPQEPCYKPRTISELYEAARLVSIERSAAA